MSFLPKPTLGGIDLGKGWEPLVEKLHKDLLEIDPDYTIDQVKEKFGTLRYYWRPSFTLEHEEDQKRFLAMRSLVSDAERDSAWICEDCGNSGQSIKTQGGWLKTLCDSCLKERNERLARME